MGERLSEPARSAQLMVWPIDAQKGRFPSKIAYILAARDPEIYGCIPQPTRNHRKQHHAAIM